MKETETEKAAVFLAIVPKASIGKRTTEHLPELLFFPFHSSKIPINGCEYPGEMLYWYKSL